MIRVYVAGPIGALDAARPAKIKTAIDAGATLLRAGFAPFVPHLWAAAMQDHEVSADALAHYEAWMDYDFAWLDASDVLVRLPGDSPGADREVERARQRGMAVYFGVDALLAVPRE